jgi:hypothetical protein
MNEMSNYQVYPNWVGKPREDENRGALRTGFVEDNADMVKRELAGYFAAVTSERNGFVRFYIWKVTPETAPFPNVGLWIGPYKALSEEIE